MDRSEATKDTVWRKRKSKVRSKYTVSLKIRKILGIPVDYVIKVKILIGLGLSRTVSFQGSTLELAIICICLELKFLTFRRKLLVIHS